MGHTAGMRAGKLAGPIVGTIIAGAVIGGILLAERRRPLRRPTRPALPRNLRNAVLGAGCAAVIAAIEQPLAQAVAGKNARQRRGFAQRLPRPLQVLGAVAAMDYGFYWWHVATHKLPCLWRFHRVHHVDPDMDASTAIRFHPADMLVSLPWRLVQVRLSGASPQSLAIWRQFFNLSILFHHSNLRLPGRWDARLARVLTTPKMHGIHHSAQAEQRDSNWTSGLSFWDRLHGTYRDDIAQGDLVIGVDDPAAAADVPLESSLRAPFRRTVPNQR